jgi:hypothetical protein
MRRGCRPSPGSQTGSQRPPLKPKYRGALPGRGHRTFIGGARVAAALAADTAFWYVRGRRIAAAPWRLWSDHCGLHAVSSPAPFVTVDQPVKSGPNDEEDHPHNMQNRVVAGAIPRTDLAGAPTRRTWSGTWPAGTGCPMHYAAPIPSPWQSRPPPPPPTARPTDLRRRAECGM